MEEQKRNPMRIILIVIAVLAFVGLTVYALNNMGGVEIAGDH